MSREIEILNPMGEVPFAVDLLSGRKRGKSQQLTIGLLNNSKPNVAYFFEAIERRIGELPDDYRAFSIVKPRSAAPCPNLDDIAERCDLVINAVAD